MKTLFFAKKKVRILERKRTCFATLQAILNVLNRIYIYHNFDLKKLINLGYNA